MRKIMKIKKHFQTFGERAVSPGWPRESGRCARRGGVGTPWRPRRGARRRARLPKSARSLLTGASPSAGGCTASRETFSILEGVSSWTDMTEEIAGISFVDKRRRAGRRGRAMFTAGRRGGCSRSSQWCLCRPSGEPGNRVKRTGGALARWMLLERGGFRS